MTGKGKPEKRREETDERESADLSLSLGFGFYHVERSESQLQRETTERRERRKSGRRPMPNRNRPHPTLAHYFPPFWVSVSCLGFLGFVLYRMIGSLNLNRRVSLNSGDNQGLNQGLTKAAINPLSVSPYTSLPLAVQSPWALGEPSWSRSCWLKSSPSRFHYVHSLYPA